MQGPRSTRGGSGVKHKFCGTIYPVNPHAHISPEFIGTSNPISAQTFLQPWPLLMPIGPKASCGLFILSCCHKQVLTCRRGAANTRISRRPLSARSTSTSALGRCSRLGSCGSSLNPKGPKYLTMGHLRFPY